MSNKGTIYIAAFDENRLIKIGATSNPDLRLLGLRTSYAGDIQFVSTFTFLEETNIFDVERFIHGVLREYREDYKKSREVYSYSASAFAVDLVRSLHNLEISGNGINYVDPSACGNPDFKLINISVDEDIHRKYQASLKRKGGGKNVKYELGHYANDYMKRVIKREETK